MNFKPLGNRVQILPQDKLAVSQGGIIIPEKAQAYDGRGEVIAISPDIPDPGFKVGDTVLYNVGAAMSPYENAGKVYHIIPHEHIIAIID